jgi:hypothetical protein
MYLWDLVGHDTAEGVIRSGIDDDLAAIMRATEPLLRERRGFLVRIVEVVCRLSVLDLDAIYVPTGRQWTGRRTLARGDGDGSEHGAGRGDGAASSGVHWEYALRPADPDVAYSLAGRPDLSAVRH